MSRNRHGSRSRRRRRARQHVVEQALLLFGKRGYAETTVEAIAAASDISPRTFYRYFPAKEDLLFYGFPDSVELLRREAERAEGTLFERLRRASVLLAGVLEHEKEHWVARLRLIFGDPGLRARDVLFNERYEEVFASAMAAEWGESEAETRRIRLLSGSIMGGIQTAMKVWVAGDGSPPLPYLAETVFDSLHRLTCTAVPVSDRRELDLTHRDRAEPGPTPAVPAKVQRRRSPGSGLLFLD